MSKTRCVTLFRTDLTARNIPYKYHQKAHYPDRDYTDGTTTYKNLECYSRSSRAHKANLRDKKCVHFVRVVPLGG